MPLQFDLFLEGKYLVDLKKECSKLLLPGHRAKQDILTRSWTSYALFHSIMLLSTHADSIPVHQRLQHKALRWFYLYLVFLIPPLMRTSASSFMMLKPLFRCFNVSSTLSRLPRARDASSPLHNYEGISFNQVIPNLMNLETPFGSLSLVLEWEELVQVSLLVHSSFKLC